jgi:hypothetical protein
MLLSNSLGLVLKLLERENSVITELSLLYFSVIIFTKSSIEILESPVKGILIS